MKSHSTLGKNSTKTKLANKKSHLRFKMLLDQMFCVLNYQVCCHLLVLVLLNIAVHAFTNTTANKSLWKKKKYYSVLSQVAFLIRFSFFLGVV